MTESLYSCEVCKNKGETWVYQDTVLGKGEGSGPYAVHRNCECRVPRSAHERPEVYPSWNWVKAEGRLSATVGHGPDEKSYWLYRDGRSAVYHSDVDDFVHYQADTRIAGLFGQIMQTRPPKDPNY